MAYSRKRLGFLVGLVALVVVGLVASGGWYMWRHYGWRTYTNACLDASFKAPVNMPVATYLPLKDGACTTIQLGVIRNDWGMSTIEIGTPVVEALPKGVVMNFSQLLPITDPAALRYTGLNTGSSVSELLHAFVADGSNGQTSQTTINGHWAAIGIVRSPDNPPSDYFSADTPYCPCTSETVFIDAGQNRLLEITAYWLNDDSTAARTSREIVNSVTFQ